MSAGSGNIGNLTVNIEAKLNEFSKGLRKGQAQMRGFERSTNSRLKKIDRQFTKTGKKVDAFSRTMKRAFAGIGAGVGVSRLGSSLNDTMRRTLRFEQQMKLVTGTIAGSKKEFKFVSDLAEELGLSIVALVPAYGKFSVAAQLAGMSAAEVKRIFIAVSEAATVNKLSMHEQELIFLALEQMINKGVVSMEELRRQLGDKLVGAFQEAAEAMGVSTAEFSKMVSSGELLSDKFLPKLAKQLHKTYGKAAVEASKSSVASINRMGNAFERLRVKIIDAGYGELVAKIADNIAAFVNNSEENLKRFSPLLNKIKADFNAIAKVTKESAKTIKDFFSSLQGEVETDLSPINILTQAFKVFGAVLQVVASQIMFVKGALLKLLGAEEEAAITLQYAEDLLFRRIDALEKYGEALDKIFSKENRKPDATLGFSKSPPKNFITETTGINPQSLLNKSEGWSEKLNHELLSSKENIARWFEEVDRMRAMAIGLDLEFNFESNFEKAVLELQYLRDEALITTQVFDRAMEELVANTGSSLEELEEPLTETQELMKRTMDSIQDSLADGFNSAFKSILDGTGSFRDSMATLLRSVAAHIFDVMVAQQAAKAIMGAFGFADGAAIQGGKVIAHAKGGVVDFPTIFPMAKGIGLMGEAGPEGILPLKRAKDGKLGVIATGLGGGVINNTSITINTDLRGNRETSSAGAIGWLQEMAVEVTKLVDDRFAYHLRPGGLARRGV